MRVRIGLVRRRRLAALVATAAVGAILTVTAASSSHAAAAPGTTSRFVPVTPRRVLDTRIGLGAPAAMVGARERVEVGIATGDPVPAEATAVVLNLTATDVRGAGYVTAYPSGHPRPEASNLNVDGPGQTVANLVVVPIGDAGRVSLFTSTGAHLLADVSGYFVPAVSAAAGRYQPVTPSRILDTRLGIGAPVTPLRSGASLVLDIRGQGGVPQSGASAVALNLTAVAASAPGFVQAYPSGALGVAGLSSNLNVTRYGQTVANMAVVPIGADGRIMLTGTAGADLLADVAGWFTDPSADDTTTGLFVPLDPVRLLDTRSGDKVRAGATVQAQAASVAGVDPGEVAALVLNVTATDTTGVGYLTAWSGLGVSPVASNLNVDKPGTTVANGAFARAAGGASVRVFTSTRTHVIVDTAGYFVGTPAVGTPTSNPTVDPPGPGEEGTIVFQALRSEDSRARRYQIRYLSRGVNNSLVEVGGTIWVPKGSSAPAGGRPVVVIGHGPYGFSDRVEPVSSSCVPSYFYGTDGSAVEWLDRGYVVAMTDYERLGTPGEHPYMVGSSAGRTMLDSARAARNLAAAEANNRVLAFGYSGGAHAALWTGELAQTYAPDLDVFGVIAVDPPSIVSDYVHSNYNSDPLATWVVYGQWAARPNLSWASILTAQGQVRVPGIGDACFNGTDLSVYGAGTFSVDPTTAPGWGDAIRESDAGKRVSPPVMLLGATRGLSLTMQDRYYLAACTLGTRVDYRVTTGTHEDIWDAMEASALAWADARRQDVAINSCSQTGR